MRLRLSSRCWWLHILTPYPFVGVLAAGSVFGVLGCRRITGRYSVIGSTASRLLRHQCSGHTPESSRLLLNAEATARRMSSWLTTSTDGSVLASSASSRGVAVCRRRARSRLQAMTTLRA